MTSRASGGTSKLCVCPEGDAARLALSKLLNRSPGAAPALTDVSLDPLPNGPNMRVTSIYATLAALMICGGPGLVAAAGAQFASENVQLQSWIDLPAFGATSGNDCWGYTSPSGREYALMGVRNAMAVVESTDPANAGIGAQIPHSNSLWGDIKTYGNYG